MTEAGSIHDPAFLLSAISITVGKSWIGLGGLLLGLICVIYLQDLVGEHVDR